MEIKTFAFLVSVGILFLVVELVRRERLTFKYAFGWLIISVIAIAFVIFDHALWRLAHWFGFELTSNFIFFALLCFFVLWSLLLTTFLCEQNSRNDTIAQKIGILEMEVQELKEKLEEKNQGRANR